MTEIELSALASQYLDRRISNAATLRPEFAAWERSRNEADSFIDWQFTTADLRIKLARLYPVSIDD
jgi:hypothetical protein